MKSNKLAICIPTYNNKKSFINLLNSILKQSYQDYSLFVSDDSDDDIIYNAFLEYKDAFNDARYFKHVSSGPANNWNNLINMCNEYEYIKFMFHDDWFTDKSSLEKFVSSLDSNDDADLAFSQTREVKPDYEYIRSISDEQKEQLSKDSNFLFLGNCISGPSAVMFRNNGYYFDNNLKWIVDNDFYMNILHNNPKFVAIDEPLISIGRIPTQLTNKCVNDKKLVRHEFLYVFKKYNLSYSLKYILRLLDKLF